jgi:putative ABC transport system substrate-binding protein
MRVLAGLLFSYVYLLNNTMAADRCVAVYYPKVREPYRSVLEEIINGIGQGMEWALHQHAITKNSKEDEVVVSDNVECDVVIGLGRSGLQAVSTAKVPAVVGGVLVQPGEMSDITGVSLMPDPKELFARLKHFVPSIETVFVIYNAGNTGQLIKVASMEAKSQGMNLMPLEASSLQKAVVMYRSVLEKMNSRSDALWLLHDPLTVDSDTVLPIVLEEAWNRKLVIFSSQAAHVKNGVLFSVYPNNIDLGKRLGKMAQDCMMNKCIDSKMLLLQDLYTAVNIRTATRLNIKVHPRRDSYVDLVFPR